jgi:hypothetical protein
MAKRLISLSEHESLRRKLHYSMQSLSQASHRNGIACPECGAELYDSAPYVTYTTNPPKKDVACSECKFQGTRIA